MQAMTITLSLLTAVVAVLTGGCETSNQTYSTNRVIDATEVSSASSIGASVAGQAARAAQPMRATGPEVLTDAPVYDAASGNVSTLTPAPQGSLNTQTPPPAAPGTLIGGVPDEPMPQYQTTSNVAAPNSAASMPPDPLDGFVPNQPLPATQPASQQVVQPAVQQAQPEPVASSSSGNWLLVDSAEAQADVNNTALEQKVLAQKAVDDSARTVYQNKIATTAGPDRYAVVKGDTLYSIAFRYGLDYHALANINKIDPPYNLAVGQVLLLNLKAQEAPSYVVQKGDTLYSIARKNGQSVNFLASVNNLEPPYTLKLGQKLLLSRENAVTPATQKENAEVPVAGSTTTTAATKPSTSTSSSSATTKPAATKPATSTVAQTPIVQTKTRKVSGVTWSWPTTSGRVIEQFSTSEQGNKGLDISGQRGQAVLAAADGQVVYSGNALRGFGNLIIINHTNEYLSAYAHNDALLVKEGQKVKRGQQIARMGNTDASSVRLHFEIRYRGQSVNPISYLPK